jgi:CTP synthase
VPGGFGDRGVEGKIRGTQFAREQGVPFLGLCLGCRSRRSSSPHVCRLEGANSTEFDPGLTASGDRLASKPEEHHRKRRINAAGYMADEDRRRDAGASGLWQPEITERHRHRYEFNMAYREQMTSAGFVISGTSPDGDLVELIELRDHPWFLACQFHPEFQSKPNKPHPLFRGFVTACLAHGS